MAPVAILTGMVSRLGHAWGGGITASIRISNFAWANPFCDGKGLFPLQNIEPGHMLCQITEPGYMLWQTELGHLPRQITAGQRWGGICARKILGVLLGQIYFVAANNQSEPLLSKN
jgi:hypothetical protein